MQFQIRHSSVIQDETGGLAGGIVAQLIQSNVGPLVQNTPHTDLQLQKYRDTLEIL